MQIDTATTKTALWLPAIAALGLIWNAYGIYQFIGSFSQTQESLMAAGMTADQAAIYLALPGWLSLAFGIGVFGGFAGSVAFMLKKAIALPVFGLSLAGYIVLFAGDVAYGVFANIPSQLAILAVVVAIAVGLFVTAWVGKRNGHLG